MKHLRREYTSRSLDESEAAVDPVIQFRRWFEEAVAAELLDANAMSLATASGTGEPAVRTVLLKEVAGQDFIFCTHYDSDKGRDLAANPRATLLFYWGPLERQVRITGPAVRSSRQESEAYFAARPRESQCAVWAATQSTTIPDRTFLEQQLAEVERRFAGGAVPCPPSWGGFRVTAERVEFWQGRFARLHDRLLYVRQGDAWTRRRLAP